MNIFLTNYNPAIASQHLDDLRLNKMILETAQILSQAYRYFFGDNDKLYKDTHINHPCCVWVRKSVKNYNWLVFYFIELNSERFYRAGKNHLSYTKLSRLFENKISGKKMSYSVNITYIDDINFDFDCSTYKDTNLRLTVKYQKTLIDKWNSDKRLPKWTKRGVPEFYKNN